MAAHGSALPVSSRTRLGAALILLVGIIHGVDAPEYLEKKPYIGVLFALTLVGSVLVALTLWRRDDRRAWALGALIAAATFVGFILSRTTGLPGFKEEEWEALGVVSLVIDAAYLLVAAPALG
jgi:hypothetical protein